MTGREDALDALAETLDALDEHLKVSDATVRRSEANRLTILHCHALFAMVVGPLFASIGARGISGPTFAVVRLIPGTPYSVGSLLAAGGLILAVATWFRAVRWEMVALWIVLSWYAIISLSFGAAVFLWLGGGMPDEAKPSVYAPFVYAHVGVVLAVHLATLRKIRRQQRKAAS